MTRRTFLTTVVGSLAALGVYETSADDRSSDSPVKIELGAEFEIMGELYAYDVAKNINKRTVAFVTLVPLHLTGPEILSHHRVGLGSRVRINAKSVRRWPAFLYPDEYEVEVDSISSSPGIPIILGLSRGNENSSGSLNPLIYRRIR